MKVNNTLVEALSGMHKQSIQGQTVKHYHELVNFWDITGRSFEKQTILIAASKQFSYISSIVSSEL